MRHMLHFRALARHRGPVLDEPADPLRPPHRRAGQWHLTHVPLTPPRRLSARGFARRGWGVRGVDDFHAFW
jgi:hypothetical protein